MINGLAVPAIRQSPFSSSMIMDNITEATVVDVVISICDEDF